MESLRGVPSSAAGRNGSVKRYAVGVGNGRDGMRMTDSSSPSYPGIAGVTHSTSWPRARKDEESASTAATIPFWIGR